MNQLLNNKNSTCAKLNYILITILPVTLFIGSLISNLVVLLICIIFLLDLSLKKNFFLIKDFNFKFLLVIYIYLILNSLFVSYNPESLFKSVAFIRFFILPYAIWYYFNFFKKDFVKFWFFIFLIVSFDILFEFFVGQNILGFSSVYDGRIASFSGDELKVGGFYFGFLFLSLAYIDYKKKNLLIPFLVFFFITALLIGERSNFLKVFIMSIFFFILFIEFSRLKKMIYILGIILTSFIIINSIPHLKGKFYYHIFNTYEEKFENHKNLNYDFVIKNSQYLRHYNAALMISKDNLLFGSGYKTFRFESYKEKYTKDGFFGASTHPHQLHFELLSEIGVIGYFLIISNLVFVLFRQTKLKKEFLTKSSILFLIATLVPLLPSGSFFTSYGATIFFINYSFLIKLKNNNFN